MNTEIFPSASPQTPAAAGDAVATAYIAAEIVKARKELKRTRIVGVVLVCVVATYITIISTTMVGFFQPGAAAQVASGMLMQHVSSDGKALTAKVEQQIPQLIRELPDYAIKELPRYRHEMEQTLETELQAHCETLSADVGYQVDLLIDSHHEAIKQVLANANNRAALRQALPDLNRTVATYLATDPDGRAIHQHITDLAVALKDVQTRMDRLAYGKNLTPEEKSARRSLALLAQAIQTDNKEPLKAHTANGKLASN